VPAVGDTINLDTFTVTISGSLTGACLDLQIPASGSLIIAAGGILEIDDAASATINVAAGGAIQASGTTASPCVIQSETTTPANFIQYTCDGTVDLEVTTFSGFEVAGWNGTMTCNDSDLLMEISGTDPVAVNLTVTLVLTRSSLRIRDTTKTWFLNLISGSNADVDKGSDFGSRLKWTLQGSATRVTLTDTPFSIEEIRRRNVVIHGDLIGASTARAKMMGMGPKMLEINGSILDDNIDEWSVLNDLYESLTEVTLSFVWDEGVFNECQLIDLVRPRKAEQAGEIFYTMRLVEITTA